MTTPRNILMLDRNCMVDRRIVLEADLLRKEGHRVALAAAYGLLGDNEREIDGLPILRFNETAVAEYGEDPTLTRFEEIWTAKPRALPLLQAELERALDEHSRERFERSSGFWGRVIGQRLGRALGLVFAPRFAARRVLAAQRLPRIVKLVAVAGFALLALDGKLLAGLGTLARETARAEGPGTRGRIAELRFKISNARVEERGPAGALVRAWRGLAYPRHGLDRLRESNHPLRAVFGLPLALLTFDPYILRHLWRFATGDFPFIVAPPPELEGMPEDVVDHFRKQPLDTWESSVLRFALELDVLDVVHAHDLPALRVATVIASQRGIPLVYDAHELYSYQPGIVGARRDRLFNTEHVLIRHVDEVVCINADQAKVMQRDHGPGSYTPLTNATTQPAGFDITRRYHLVSERIGLPEGTPTMLFMGGINRGRKIDLLLEGLAQARVPAHMIFLTWGMEIPEFEALASKLGIRDRVHFLDPVPWSEIVYWAASVDVGVMPYQALDLNTRISSPNKMYEFIAAGTPMIGSSELVNVARVVTPEGFGVLLPLHEAADYAQLIDAIFDPAAGGPERFRPALIAKAHKYLWEAEAQGFAAMYRRLLSELDAGDRAESIATAQAHATAPAEALA